MGCVRDVLVSESVIAPISPEIVENAWRGRISERLVDMRETRLVTAAAFAFLWLPFAASAQDKTPTRPNVVVIYTDDQGYGDASCLNPDSKFQTPNIDRLAAEGMTFTDGHSSDSVCTPSRYGLLTGRYSWRTTLKRGVFGAEVPCLIADDRVTIPSMLRSVGYTTHMVGKWHLGMDFPGKWSQRDWSQPTVDMPLDKGFDTFWGIPASMNYGVLAWFDGRLPITPPALFTRKKPNEIALADYRIMPPYDDVSQGKKDLEVASDFIDSACLTKFTDEAVRVMEQASGLGSPFFLYLPYTSPHKPVIPIDRFRGQSHAGAYGDFMMETDWHVGRVLETLDRLGVAENTLVFFSSDNGPEATWKERAEKFAHQSNAIYRDGKRSVYEGGHRVPFFVRWPAAVEAGSRWDGPVCQTDLLATLAEVVGFELDDNAAEDSESFAAILRNDPRDKPIIRGPMVHHSINSRYAVRHQQWKLVMEDGKESRELYNLKTDPGEQQDVINDHPAIAQSLFDQLVQVVSSGSSSNRRSGKNDTPLWPDVSWAEQSR